jgi:hypothetical protein
VNLTAMTADIPVTRLQIGPTPTKHRPHFSHPPDRIWRDAMSPQSPDFGLPEMAVRYSQLQNCRVEWHGVRGSTDGLSLRGCRSAMACRTSPPGSDATAWS